MVPSAHERTVVKLAGGRDANLEKRRAVRTASSRRINALRRPQQTLMRGLDTAFPLFVRGCLYLPAGVDLGSATQFIRGFPTEALSPAPRNREGGVLDAILPV
jgi:hypothetical protein